MASKKRPIASKTDTKIRRGFKITAEKTISTETISFEDVEDETTATPYARRKRNSASATSIVEETSSPRSKRAEKRAREDDDTSVSGKGKRATTTAAASNSTRLNKSSPTSGANSLKSDENITSGPSPATGRGRRSASSAPAPVDTDDDDAKAGTKSAGTSARSGMKSSGSERNYSTGTGGTVKAVPSTGRGKVVEGMPERTRDKSHYPSIPFDVSKFALQVARYSSTTASSSTNTKSSGSKAKSSSSSSADATLQPHWKILQTIIEEVCEVETNGLRGSLGSTTSSSSSSDDSSSGVAKARAAILSALEDVLSELPSRVEKQCPEDATFESELSLAERQELEALQNKLESLRQQTANLARYEADITAFGREHGIWLEGAPPVPMSASSSSSSSSSSSGGRGRGRSSLGSQSQGQSPPGQHQNTDLSGVHATAASYMTLLEGMDASCASIIADVAGMRHHMTQAKKSQERVYDAYKKAQPIIAARGLAAASSSSSGDVVSGVHPTGAAATTAAALVPSDTKDIMRRLQKNG